MRNLEVIKLIQQNWVIPGTTKYNQHKDLTHNVSCTIIVQENEWESVIEYLYKNREYFAAVSLLPATGDKIYKQAPMEAITTPEDELKWSHIISSFKTVDYTQLKEKDDKTELQQELSCAGGQCEVIK